MEKEQWSTEGGWRWLVKTVLRSRKESSGNLTPANGFFPNTVSPSAIPFEAVSKLDSTILRFRLALWHSLYLEII